MSLLTFLIGLFIPVAHATDWGSSGPGVQDMWDQIRRVMYTGTAIKNPTGIDDPFYAIVFNIINFVFPLVGAVAVLVIIYAGIRIITAQGKDDQVSQAKTMIIYACAGVILAIMASTIVAFIAGTFLPQVLK